MLRFTFLDQVAEQVEGSHSNWREDKLSEEPSIQTFVEASKTSFLLVNFIYNAEGGKGASAFGSELNSDFDHNNRLDEELSEHASEGSDREVPEEVWSGRMLRLDCFHELKINRKE